MKKVLSIVLFLSLIGTMSVFVEAKGIDIGPLRPEICPVHLEEHQMERIGTLGFANVEPPQPMALFKCDCGLEMVLSGYPDSVPTPGPIAYYLTNNEFSYFSQNMEGVMVYTSYSNITVWHYTSSTSMAGMNFNEYSW